MRHLLVPQNDLVIAWASSKSMKEMIEMQSKGDLINVDEIRDISPVENIFFKTDKVPPQNRYC